MNWLGKDSSNSHAWRHSIRLSSNRLGTNKRAPVTRSSDLAIRISHSPKVGLCRSDRFQGTFKAIRSTFALVAREAGSIWTTISRVLSVAKDRSKIGTNVYERGDRLDDDRAPRCGVADDRSTADFPAGQKASVCHSGQADAGTSLKGAIVSSVM